MPKWVSRAAVSAFVMVFAVAAGSALLLSPIALSSVAELAPAQRWTLLSEVGQAYGPVAALISAAALAGVVVSVAMQARATRIAGLQALRTRHFEIARLSIENPPFTQASGGLWRGPDDDFDVQLRFLTNQWISHWGTMYDLRQLNEVDVRRVARGLFRGEAGREYWRKIGIGHRDTATRRQRKFVRMFDEELRKAEAVAPRPVVRPTGQAKSASISTTVLGVVAVIELAILIWQRKRR
ncbi:DUF6082 family protein [Nonomuraea terrae]|uniref:DUF6082 family protein n=1 Tax=Nonomuraea terrae TaxID=2530383 RepID=UPI0037A73584